MIQENNTIKDKMIVIYNENAKLQIAHQEYTLATPKALIFRIYSEAGFI